MASGFSQQMLAAQRKFFATGKTRPAEFREQALDSLAEAVHALEPEIEAALVSDLGKPGFESYLSEIIFLYDEIKYARKHLRRWMKPRRVRQSLLIAPASGKIHSEPLGTVLIVGPWNYPFQLAMAPLVAAIAAGNTAVVKPSEISPATSAVIAKVLAKAFPPEYVTTVEGGVEVSRDLLAEKWDHIFFTGGTEIGRHVMLAAAKHLTPVTLELGGKSPCIVEEDADLDVTARRVVWGKFFNAGQTCIAPDYLLVHAKVREPLLQKIAGVIDEFFGANKEASPDFARIVSERHFKRLESLLDGQTVRIGGEKNAATRFLAPTVLYPVAPESRVMQEEIFGPILPVLEYARLDDAIEFVRTRAKPLALYFFSADRAKQQTVNESLSFGGGCMNDTLVHLTSPSMPFGGVGDSGMGAYHGHTGFETFSHRKSLVTRGFFLDPKLRYPPYRDRVGLLKKFLGR